MQCGAQEHGASCISGNSMYPPSPVSGATDRPSTSVSTAMYTRRLAFGKSSMGIDMQCGAQEHGASFMSGDSTHPPTDGPSTSQSTNHQWGSICNAPRRRMLVGASRAYSAVGSCFSHWRAYVVSVTSVAGNCAVGPTGNLSTEIFPGKRGATSDSTLAASVIKQAPSRVSSIASMASGGASDGVEGGIGSMKPETCFAV